MRQTIDANKRYSSPTGIKNVCSYLGEYEDKLATYLNVITNDDWQFTYVQTYDNRTKQSTTKLIKVQPLSIYNNSIEKSC